MAFACDICRTLSLAPALATGHPGWVAWSMRAPIQRIFGADMKVSIVIAPASVPRPTRTIFLAAKLNAALWIAKTVAECGSGDLFQTMNKGASDDDLGFTLQSGLVTKALVGLFGSNRFRLAVSVDGSTVFDGLSVDNATGIIDQPRLPPFKAYTNYDNNVGVGSWTKIGINNTDYNDQGAFDAANNHFVAPVDGTYLFGATLLYKNNASATARMRGRLVLNGTTEIRGSFGESSATHVTLATAIWLQTMVPLTAGDTVELQGYFRVADGYFAADHTSFWGAKIG